MIRFSWTGQSQVGAVHYTCGYCGAHVGTNQGYFGSDPNQPGLQARVYACTFCTRPTFLIATVQPGRQEAQIRMQIPAPAYGNDVDGLPAGVKEVYRQARDCMSVEAYGATVMLCRKLLMHVAVERGADPGKTFAEYVQFFVNNGYIAPTNQPWVDAIRQGGNEANHELPPQSKDDATKLLEFSEMLLKIVYEYPARA